MRNQKKTACFSAFLDDFFLSGSEFVIPGVVNFIPYVKQPMRLFPRDTTNPLRRKHKNEILSHRFMVHPSKTYLLKTSLPIKKQDHYSPCLPYQIIHIVQKEKICAPAFFMQSSFRIALQKRRTSEWPNVFRATAPDVRVHHPNVGSELQKDKNTFAAPF